MIVKGAVIPAVASEENREPLIKPSFQALQPGGSNPQDSRQQIEHNRHTDGNQRADTGSLCGLGLGVLPNQEQNQAYNGNATAQDAPAKAAIIRNGGSGGNAAVGTDNSGVIDLLSAILTKILL